MSDRPNILYVFTDQQSAFAMSCMGNPDLHTPTMDRLAEQGVLFENAYCTQPLCTPCRGSMFTGKMPHEINLSFNSTEGIPEHLRAQELGNLVRGGGYDCVYGGKWHVPEIAMPEDNDHGFRTICGFDDQKLPAAGVDYLDEFVKRPASGRDPFFMVLSYNDPHNICQLGRSQPLPDGPLEVDRPRLEDCPNVPANFEPPAFESEVLRLGQKSNWQIYAYQDRSAEDWRRFRWGYYRLIERLDARIAPVIDRLDEHGLLDDTLIVFTSDHGDGHGAHRWNQKSCLYEEVVRIPMIVRPPGGCPARVDREHLVSNGLDLLPTLCDYAGVEAPEGLQGMSLRPLVEGDGAPTWRDHVVVETAFDGSGNNPNTPHGRSVRTARYKYTVYDRGRYAEMLVDMERDPGEMVNLAVETKYAHVVQQHRELLRKWMTETNDTFRPSEVVC